jgi:hypothetical protein
MLIVVKKDDVEYNDYIDLQNKVVLNDKKVTD